MLNYKLMGDNDYIFDAQGTIFRNRGIEDIDRFLNLDETATHSYKLLKNIDRAVECLVGHIENKSKIFIMIDPDVDGYTSSAILYQYLKMIDKSIDITWRVHEGKQHGISNIDIPNNIGLVITPDSGSNDIEKHKELFDRGIDLIVLDHHEMELESEYAIVVNTQLGYPNLNLSGAGVTWKFCKALDDAFNVNYADYFLDLVALGCISDSMQMTELETRYLAQRGLEEINNDFFLALLQKQEYSTKGEISFTNISFYVSPLINATIRVGSLQDKIDMFRSFIGDRELIKYKSRSGEILEPLQTSMARRCANLRGKQNRMRDKLLEVIEQKIVDENLNSNKALFVHSIEGLEGGLTGLIAGKLAGNYKKPVILLRDNEEEGLLTGSARGYDKSGLKDFKEIVQKSDLFEFAQGHPQAFGCAITKENADFVDIKLNQLLKEYIFDDIYTVDFEIDAQNVSQELIEELYGMRSTWGKGIEEPYLAIKKLYLKDCEIYLMGQTKNTISIRYGDISYVLFNTSKEVFNDLESSKDQSIDLVGRASMNFYNDNTNPQIIIEDFELVKQTVDIW
jgi:single-stranded-DNA-specific exonuclease